MLQASKFGFPRLPNYASLVGGTGDMTDVTVAAVTAAASAAAAAAAAAVVAAAGREIEIQIQVTMVKFSSSCPMFCFIP